MSIQQQIVLRYRSEGHLRFSLPSVLCTGPYADTLVSGLYQLDGVYRVTLYRRQGKLSIRFLEAACDVPRVSRRLYDLVNQVSQISPQEAQGPLVARKKTLRQRLKESRPARWLREKVQEGRETVTAATILAKRGLKGTPALGGERPRWLTEFLNDMLMLYLIRVHWHLITQHWLLHPIRYRYEWSATLYLIYLMVQSRIPKSTQ